MPSSTSMFIVLSLVLLQITSISAENSSSSWKTLKETAPLVIANGGFSGLFPGFTYQSYEFANSIRSPNQVQLCNLHFTKDKIGICVPDIKLDNFSDIALVYPNRSKEYTIKGVLLNGYFSVDFSSEQLKNVTMRQRIFSRTPAFDGMFPIMTISDFFNLNLPSIWLDCQNVEFYSQKNLSVIKYIRSLRQTSSLRYISSTNIAFLEGIAKIVRGKKANLVYDISDAEDVQTVIKNLTNIKLFASAIRINKKFIYPVDDQLYLLPHTDLVTAAHKAGIQVFASDFYNDAALSYNYSYDALAECLLFINNGVFSVDGIVSDFPITPSEAIGCFSNLGENASETVKVLIISKYGASGDYPGCTDKAYQKAILDGADVIDCPVQFTKDGIPCCMVDVDLFVGTTVADSGFRNLVSAIPEIQKSSGLFTFSLTWENISSLAPLISSPYSDFNMLRNPKNKNAGKFMTLSDFLAMAANSSSLSGVLISMENAAYLIKNQQVPVVDKVLDALKNAGYDNHTSQKVMIQSSDSSVLQKMRGLTHYELVYKIDEDIGQVLASAIDDMKGFADSVVISKNSVFADDMHFLTYSTSVISDLKSKNLTVYVETFRNEFVSQAWDFFSDSTVEINTYVFGSGIDGLVTEFPLTADRFIRNTCSGKKQLPSYMDPVQPGGLSRIIPADVLSPIPAPSPSFTDSEVTEPPLPNLVTLSPSPSLSPKPAAAPPLRQPSAAFGFPRPDTLHIVSTIFIFIFCS